MPTSSEWIEYLKEKDTKTLDEIENALNILTHDEWIRKCFNGIYGLLYFVKDVNKQKKGEDKKEKIKKKGVYYNVDCKKCPIWHECWDLWENVPETREIEFYSHCDLLQTVKDRQYK